MKLILSDEGKTISGTATFKSGNWTDPIDYKRVHLASPFVDLGNLGSLAVKPLNLRPQRASLRDLSTEQLKNSIRQANEPILIETEPKGRRPSWRPLSLHCFPG